MLQRVSEDSVSAREVPVIFPVPVQAAEVRLRPASSDMFFMVNLCLLSGCFYQILMTTDMVCTVQKFLCVFFQKDFSLVHDDHFFENIGSLLNDMCGNNKRSSCLCVFIQKKLIKLLSGYHIQTGYRLIQKCEWSFACHSCNDRYHREHTFGDFSKLLFDIQMEFLHQAPAISLSQCG